MDDLFNKWMRHMYHREFLARCNEEAKDGVGADEYPEIDDLGMICIFRLAAFKAKTHPGARTDSEDRHAFLPALILYLEDGGYYGDFRLLNVVLKRTNKDTYEYCPCRIGLANATSLEYFSLRNASVKIHSGQLSKLGKVGYTTSMDIEKARNILTFGLSPCSSPETHTKKCLMWSTMPEEEELDTKKKFFEIHRQTLPPVSYTHLTLPTKRIV